MLKKVVIVFSLLLTLSSCYLRDPLSIYWTSKKSDYLIVLECNLFKDAEVLLYNGKERYHLFYFNPLGSNEKIVEFTYSEDEDKLGFLIGNSKNNTFGSNLLVFSVADLITDSSISPLFEVKDIQITDFTITNENINYSVVDSVLKTVNF